MWLNAITKNLMWQVYEHDDCVDSWQGSNESQHIYAETESTPVSRRNIQSVSLIIDTILYLIIIYYIV